MTSVGVELQGKKTTVRDAEHYNNMHFSHVPLSCKATSIDSNANIDVQPVQHSSETSLQKNVPSEKGEDSSDDVIESDYTDTDYELESAVRHAYKKKKCRSTFEELGAPSIFALLSPSVREVTKNVELVRLPLVGLKARGSYKSDNQLRQELWPGVGVGGAAIQCIHCHESGRQVVHSLSFMWQHLGRIAYYHFSQCKKIPPKKWQHLQALVPRVGAPNFQSFQTELGLLCQHVSESLQHNNQISVPLVQTHQHNLIRSRGRDSRGRDSRNSRGSDVRDSRGSGSGSGRSNGLRVYDLNKLEYYNRLNKKMHVVVCKLSCLKKLDCYTIMRQSNERGVIKANGVTKTLQGETCKQAPHEIILKKRKSTEKGSPVKKGLSLVMHLEEISRDKNESGRTSFAYKKIS